MSNSNNNILVAGLYVIATPIGNLQDITLRALTILHSLDTLYAEDTRVTGVLLQRHDITVPLHSYREAAPRHQVEHGIQQIIELIRSGKKVGYVSDAGTPGISDPGDYLVQKVREAGLAVIPVPGVSALATILSISGLAVQRPIFVGFLPRKKGKETLMKKLREGLGIYYDGIVFYESPERVVNLLEMLQKWDGTLRVCIGRELTKKFETFYVGNIENILQELLKYTTKGEITMLVTLDA